MKPITILRRRAKLGDQGYPMASVAFYGPDNKRATKVVLGIVTHEGAEPQLYKWFSESKDIRYDPAIQLAILSRIQEHSAASVIMSENLFGCPHEEGTDYPEGEACPLCPYWKERDRYANFAGEEQ
jgi:hypothetical protein